MVIFFPSTVHQQFIDLVYRFTLTYSTVLSIVMQSHSFPLQSGIITEISSALTHQFTTCAHPISQQQCLHLPRCQQLLQRALWNRPKLQKNLFHSSSNFLPCSQISAISFPLSFLSYQCPSSRSFNASILFASGSICICILVLVPSFLIQSSHPLKLLSLSHFLEPFTENQS